MKPGLRVFAALLLLILPGLQTATACMVNVESFRKTFRDSKNVFLGEIIAIDSIKTEELSEEIQARHKDFKYLGKITFKVERSWKGTGEKQLTVYSPLLCTCPTRYTYFSVGKKYLIFSDKRAYFDSCNLFNSQVDSPETGGSLRNDQFVKNNIKRLNDFWFRSWARIYPF